MFDARIIDPWPKDVVEALDDLRQGDVIPWPPDTAYVTTDRHVLYGDQPDDNAETTGEQELAALDPAPELAVITSQTCDIDEQGLPRRKPWIQYAPLFKVSEDTRLGLTTFELDGPDLPDGEWYADLRIEGCAEKSILAGMTPIRGFATERDADRFGEHLGHLRARPALANHLIDTVTEHLRQYRKNASKGKRNMLKREIAEVRLDIQDGSRMEPHAVRLVALHSGEPRDETKEWFAEWFDAAREAAAAAEIELHAVHHVDATALDYPAIKDSVIVDLSG